MIVIRGYSSDPARSLMDPLLENRWSIFFELRGGDVCDPLNGNWFSAPYPTRVWRWFCKRPVLPFLAWRLGKKGGYIGFKAYGVDSPEYRNWPAGILPEDVFDGSQALCLSFRPFATIKD